MVISVATGEPGARAPLGRWKKCGRNL